MGTLPPEESRRVAAHLATCADCAEEHEAARGMEPWAKRAAETIRPPASRVVPFPSRFWRPAAVAASLVLVAAIGWRVVLERPDSPPVDRGSSIATANASPPDGATLTEPPRRLAWKDGGPAEAHQILLLDAEATPLWEGPRTPEPGVEVPADVRGRLQAGETYYWRGVAFQGLDRRESPLFRFRLEPDAP